MFGLSPFLAKLFGGVLVLAAFGGVYLLWQRDAARLETAQINLSAANEENTTLTKRNSILEQAAIERDQDDSAVTKMSKDLNDAIRDIPAGNAPSPAALALGCERLRRAGATTSDSFIHLCVGR